MKRLLIISALLFSTIGFSQPEVYIHFNPTVEGNEFSSLDLGSTVFHDLSGTAFQVEAFNYYISKLKLTHDGGQIIDFPTADDVKLVKVQSHVFNLGFHNITTLEQVDFGVGVHVDFNHLDPNLYPTGHPLGNQQNPVMQWGWTGGYFIMALDAMGDNNADDICDQLFQPHCLGDASYKNVSLTMTGVLDVPTNIYHINVTCNLDEWIYNTDPGVFGVQHTDQAPIPAVMNNVDNRPVFTATSTLGLNEVQEVGDVFFTNTENAVKIEWKEMKAMKSFSLIDMNGRVVEKSQVKGPSGSVTIGGIKSGYYIFNCYTVQGKLIHSINVVH
jgi:hypothetical protein